MNKLIEKALRHMNDPHARYSMKDRFDHAQLLGDEIERLKGELKTCCDHENIWKHAQEMGYTKVIDEQKAQIERLKQGANRWARECRKYEAKAAEIERLQAVDAEIERLEGLLKAAKCPNSCEGGVIVKGAYQHDNGEIKYDLEQCQWCDEVAARDTGDKQGSG